MVRKTIQPKKSERGQAFMELAISIIFLLILLSALIDLGWAFYTLIAMRDAAQEAAVYGSMCPPTSDLADLDGHRALIIDRLQKSATTPLNIADIPADKVGVCVIDPNDPPPSCSVAPPLEPAFGYSVRVELEVEHEIRTPFVATFIGTTTYPLRVNVSDTILRVVAKNCK